MKINAYILAADPAWIEASVLSYYDVVDRIVVSYDENGRGWTGVPIDVEQCLWRLKAIDKDRKFDYRPGSYGRQEFFDQPMVNETYQRQCALNEASVGARWVLQLDTDEIVGGVCKFLDALSKAEELQKAAMNYPSIWLYTHAFGRWYLEVCQRGWRRMAGYPGPLAVRAGSNLSHARRIAQPDSSYFHADVQSTASPVAFPNNISVDHVVSVSEAVFHFSWVRSEAWLRRKFATWSHAKDKNWTPELTRWLQASHHPLIASVLSQFERGVAKRALRMTRIPTQIANLIGRSSDDGSAAGASKPYLRDPMGLAAIPRA